MAGLALIPGSEARRELTNATVENIDALQRTAIKQRNARAILEQALRNPDAETNLLTQSSELIRGLDYDSAGRILYYLADKYHRTGRWTMAAETFTILADRYPQHPLARQALLWLVQYYASGEIAWQEHSVRNAIPRQPLVPAIVAAKLEDRLARAVTLGKQIERTRPDLFAEPALRFPLAAAWRNQGSPRPAEQFYLAESRGLDRDAWSACAKGEISLTDPNTRQPKPTQLCWKAAAKPKLDGRLDDAVWQKIESVPLKSPLNDDDQWPALAAFAYDADFLYIAVTCRRAPGVKYEPAPTPRPRDADLTARDRVDILIDIDRDFATYYQFSFDYRGFTADSLWGDPTWNPTWFVAADLTDEAWTVEAAIPLNQLTAWRRRLASADGHPSGDAKNTGKMPVPPDDAESTGKMTVPPVKSREVWAVGVQRTIPGVGFQSWSTPASTQVMPEGFGYLIFQ
jgi:hypothetical protein